MTTQCSLMFSRHPSLSSIAPGRSSCWLPFFPLICLVGLCFDDNTFSSFLFQRFSACFIRLTWTVFRIGSRWPYNFCFVEACFQDFFFKTASIILVYLPSSFFSMHFVNVHLVHPHISMDTVTAWKKSCFVLSDRSHFGVFDNLSIVFYSFTRRMLTSLSVDEMLVTIYMTWFTKFGGLTLKLEITACLKHVKYVLFTFAWRPLSPAGCYWLYSWNSAWDGVVARSARLSA